jgi:GAF domain-containing protein
MAAGLGLFAEEAFVGFEQPADRGLVGRCLRERRAVLVGDVTAEPDYFSTPTTRRVWSELDVPIEIDGRPWGAITVQDCSPGAFDEVDANCSSRWPGNLPEPFAPDLRRLLHSNECAEFSLSARPAQSAPRRST